MTKLQCYVLSNFSFTDKTIDTHRLADIFTERNVDFESGFQILDIDIRSSVHVQIEALKRSPTYLLDFDTGSEEVVRKESFLFTRSLFEINLEQRYLITYGSLSQNNDAKAFLKRAGLNHVINQLYINITDFYESSRSKYDDISLKAVTIKKFNYRNGIIGRFSGEILDNSVVSELLQSYSKDFLKGTFAVTNGDYSFDLQIFASGAFKILSNDDKHQEILENLIPNLLNNYG